MKIIILLLAAGACLANQQAQEPGWDIGKTYTYSVQGHALSGLRVDQHGGLQLKYKIKLTRQGQNQYYLQPKDFQVMTNCLKECEKVQNRPIPQSLLQHLESPIQFSMTPQGKVQSIRFEHSTPQWAMNFKKAQMAPFVSNTMYPQQVTRQQQQDPQQSKQQQEEKTVYGQCKVQYIFEQYGQQQQQEQQSQYSPQQQQQQQQRQQQRQGQPWYQRIAGFNNDDSNESSGSSESQQQGSGDRQQQQQQQQQRRRGQQQQNQDQQNRQQHQNQNRYGNNDESSQEDNSAQGFFAKLGRKMGMGSDSGSSESQEQQQQQNQIRHRNGQQQQESSEEQGQAERKNCDSSDQKFQFLKMYQVSDCSHTPNFSNSSSSSTQRQINKRQVFTRYYACGQSKNNYNIYHIERREATKQSQEAVQQLTLVDISSASDARNKQIQQASTYSNLAYNFEVQQLKQKPIVEMDKQEYQKQLRSRAGVGQIDIFQENDFQGQHTTLDVPVGKCLGLPQGWNDAISSVDPQLSCIILWEHRGCSGEAVRLERFSWGASQLSRVNMDNRATAIQLC